MNMAGKTVVFDLDGTLADTSTDLLAAANACFIDLCHGPMLGPEDALTAFHGGRAMLRLGFSRLNMAATPELIEAEQAKLLVHYLDGLDRTTQLYPGAVEAVMALRAAGAICTICTNKPEGLAEELLRRLGVRDLFAALIGADTLPVKKPDAAPYRAAVERAGGQVARSMLLGDTVTDRDTARAAGVPVALVTFGPEGQGVQRLAPDALLHHFGDLPALAHHLIS